jgi:hypothetical protein
MRSRLAFAALLSTLLLGGVALAAIPSSDGWITLCYDKSTQKGQSAHRPQRWRALPTRRAIGFLVGTARRRRHRL